MTSESLATFPRRLATSRRFTLGVPRSFRVSDDGETVLFLRSSSGHDPVNNLWKHRRGDSEPTLLYDAGTSGPDTVSVAEEARRERAREQAAGVVTYVVSNTFSHAYFVLGSQLHAVDVADGSHRILRTDDVVFDPRPQPTEPDSPRLVAYVSGRSLRITDGDTDWLVPGTDDGSENISWGSAEFIAAEEMDRSRGFWWSPDGGHIIAARVDVSEVETWWVSSPESPGVAPRPIRYPAAGTANVNLQLWILDPTNGPITQVDWQQGEFEYLTNVSWGGRLLASALSRDQRTLSVLDVEPTSGKCTEVQRLTDDLWVELGSGSPTELNGTFAYVADDATARRLVVDGVVVTPDDVYARQIHGHIDGEPIITMSADPTTAVVARVQASGELNVLSTKSGWATAVVGGDTMVISQAVEHAASTHTIHWHDGSTTMIDSVGDEPGFPCTPDFHIVADRRLRTALCLPHDHDGSPLPVLMDPYGGPHAQRVVRARNAFATSQWFAEQGFAVVVVDGRGTPGRGPTFERAVWGDLAGPVLDDQVAALQGLADERSELDLGHVGIRGWSFGGYLAALAVLRRPDVFTAAVAGAPVTDWLLYDTHYTERYLGHPADHPDHYERSSLINEAHLLSRPLMLIHGLADDNVVAAHTIRLSRALLESGRAHEVLPLSGVTHMTPQEQVAENLLHLQRDFLLRHLR